MLHPSPHYPLGYTGPVRKLLPAPQTSLHYPWDQMEPTILSSHHNNNMLLLRYIQRFRIQPSTPTSFATELFKHELARQPNNLRTSYNQSTRPKPLSPAFLAIISKALLIQLNIYKPPTHTKTKWTKCRNMPWDLLTATEKFPYSWFKMHPDTYRNNITLPIWIRNRNKNFILVPRTTPAAY